MNAHVSTFGTALAGAYPEGPWRQVDVLFWTAAQTGESYGQDHRALAVAGEAGLQWTATPWKPWVRAGYTHASGDDDPNDDTHGTFFQILPTVSKYSLSATYAVMNLNDAFVQMLAASRPALTIRADVRGSRWPTPPIAGTSAAGATQASATVFGCATRLSQGHRRLGTMLEGSADYRINRR